MSVKSLIHHRTVARLTASVLALGLAGAALAGCSSSDSGSAQAAGTEAHPTTISFWGWVPGLEDLVDTYNKAHKTVHVDFHRMTGDDGAKVKAAVDAGAGPDVVQLSSHDLPDYVMNKRVQDITPYVKDEKSKYTAASWAAASVGGKVYGIPQGIGPTGLMYRKDILEKYGIAVPKTWPEYLEAAQKLHAADPNVYIANIAPSEIGQWVQEVQQADGTWFSIDKDAWKVSVDGEASRQVAERWQTLLDQKLVLTDTMWTPQYWADVNAGKIATIEYAAWFPVSLAENAKQSSGNWRVAAQPQIPGSDASGDSGGASDVVLKGAKNPKAAAEFISWLNGSPDTQDTFIKVGGLFPATKSGLASPALDTKQEYYGGQDVNAVFKEAAKNTPSTWIDGPNYSTASKAITDNFAEVVNGKMTFVQALEAAQKATVADLKSRGINVKG